MDPRSEKLLLIGYAEDLKAYKIFNPLTKQASYARSVIVHEAALSPSPMHSRTGDPSEPGGDIPTAEIKDEEQGSSLHQIPVSSFTEEVTQTPPPIPVTAEGVIEGVTGEIQIDAFTQPIQGTASDSVESLTQNLKSMKI